MGEANRNLSLIVRVGAQVYALSLTEVVKVMRALPVSPLVGAPDCVRGLSLIRGSPSPVVDFGKLLTNEKQTQSTRFVTVRAGQRTVALAVDVVVGICELAPALLRDLPACQFAGLVNHLPVLAWLSVCPECQYSSASRPLTDQGSSKY